MHRVVFSLVFFLCLFTPLGANSLNFENIKELPNGDIRISFKLQKVALINAYALDDPSRIVIDVRDTKVSSFSEENNLGPLKLVRASDQNNLSRIVIDLKESVYWKKPWQIKSKDHVKLILEIKQSQKVKKNTRDILIAIDAGHGGKDPGSVGTNILEKDVTLMIAKELERTLRDTQGYKPIMIRSTDVFVNLDDRYQKARELGADLFVSIHADGFRLSRVKGASVYVWSEEASSITAENLSKAKLVADSSIKSKVGRLDFQDFDEDAARAIYQLAYEAKIENSIILGEKILEQLKRDPFTHMHKPNVEFADFRVLKSIDIPSVLVESGFITNPDDSRRLSKKPGRRMIARSIFLGIHEYFKVKPKPNTIMDPLPEFLTYTIQKGDVISEIAIRFGVTVNEVIKWNELDPSSIFPGQDIKIYI